MMNCGIYQQIAALFEFSVSVTLDWSIKIFVKGFSSVVLMA
jgi:hypothetical protein